MEAIFPVLEESSFLEHKHIPVDCKAGFIANGDNEDIIREIRQSDGVIVVGGGRIIDFCKVACSLADHSPYISIPTAASHDGFSSPYVGFLLRRQIKQEKIPYEPQSPLGIIGDTWLISQAPYKMLSSGAADTLAKFTAVKDWKLANKDTKFILTHFFYLSIQLFKYGLYLFFCLIYLFRSFKTFIKSGFEINHFHSPLFIFSNTLIIGK